MACMCGDICCSSCGPAQGNYRCPFCRTWASEGCEHVDESGNLKDEFFDQLKPEETIELQLEDEDDVSI